MAYLELSRRKVLGEEHHGTGCWVPRLKNLQQIGDAGITVDRIRSVALLAVDLQTRIALGVDL